MQLCIIVVQNYSIYLDLVRKVRKTLRISDKKVILRLVFDYSDSKIWTTMKDNFLIVAISSMVVYGNDTIWTFLSSL